MRSIKCKAYQLQWIDGHDTASRPFDNHQGSWRPDFLIEEVTTTDGPGSSKEHFRVCEINARFAFNGFLITAYGQQGLLDLGAERKGFKGAAESDDVSKHLSATVTLLSLLYVGSMY